MLTIDIKNRLKEKMKIVQNQDQSSVCLVGPVTLPIQLENKVVTFKWYTWLKLKEDTIDKDSVLDSITTASLADLQQSSILVYGDFENSDHPLVRFHSICHTGDIFGSKRCDCGYQLHQSLKMIVENGHGALFYLANHEGRGIGLFSKSLAYLLQEEGYDTVEANHALGFEDDLRTYEEPLMILQELRSKPVILITNNPKKLFALKEKGLSADSHQPLWGDSNLYNKKYLETKVMKSGHIPEQKEITI
ncbi:GTP cyclohydrolase II [Neobacillus sp. LXY-4]|uniref:GTP cyclohydrolase II n=1 Tax=Neobacillus sp. LXY-4 TaxID=3379826 RepID=UPI003EE14AA0